MNRTHFISVITLIVFGFLLLFNVFVSWVIYLFYIWVALFAVVSASQFWILANMVFNSREAKRLFGFIGAGAIAGGIFGGYLTSIIAPVLGSEKLLFVSAITLYLCIPITRSVWNEKNVRIRNPFVASNEKKLLEESTFLLIKKSKHLLYLAGIVGISVIAAKLVDYQFNAIASAKIKNPDDLTAFFGFWFSNFNLISLVIQLFITRKVVCFFVVGTSLFFLPGGLFLGAILILFAPTLFAAIFIKLIDGSLKQSINKSAVELLALPIPINVKNKAKSFIDIFVDSVATGIGGLILILLVNAFHFSTNSISLITIIVLIVWFFFALNVRKEYLKSFHLKLKQTGKGDNTKAQNFSNESVIKGLIGVLNNGNEKQILWVLSKTRENPNDLLFASIYNLLKHESSNVRAEALRNLYFYNNKTIYNDVSLMINDQNQDVKIRAFEYLLTHNKQDKFILINKYLIDSDYQISGAALLSLANEVRNNPELKNQYELRQLIGKKIEALATEQDVEIEKFNTKTILEAIGRGHISSYFWFIDKCFENTDPEIISATIKAAGFSMAENFVDKLLNLINNSLYEKDVAEALPQYGVEILSFLEKELNDVSKHETHRKIPAIIQNIESQQSVRILFRLLDSEDFQVRNEALNSLNKLKKNFPFLNFDKNQVIRRILNEARIIQDTLSVLYLQTKLEKESIHENQEQLNSGLLDARKSLIILLERRLDGSLERVFRLLGLKFPSDEIKSAYQSFQSNKPDIRMSSIEFLENLLDSKLKRVLIPIFETTALETLSKEAILNLNIHIPVEHECYVMLLNGNDIKIKLAVLYLISFLNDKNYLELVSKYENNANPKVRDFARKAIHALNQK